MATRFYSGPNLVSGGQDKDGERTYKVQYIVAGDTGLSGDGPSAVLDTPGLPQPGSFYSFFGDSDQYAFCWWERSVKPHPDTNEQTGLWYVDLTFSTKPENKFCRNSEKTDPVLEPPKISGSFAKYVEEASRDINGRPITNSAWEQIRGTTNEWDKNRLSVKIEQNVLGPYQGYILPTQMIDCVNKFPLWGLPARTIKLSSAPWRKEFYGPCYAYYARTLDFDIRYNQNDDGFVETWDRVLLDEGGKVLNGHWNVSTGEWTLDPIPGASGTPNPDPNNPQHFMKFIDRQGNPIKGILDGAGKPAFATVTHPDCVSIVGTNLNHPLPTSGRNAFWVCLSGTGYSDWNNGQNYLLGDTVLIDIGGAFLVYVALSNNINQNPPAVPAVWTLLGVSGQVPDQRGAWDAQTAYALGDEVSNPNTQTNAGQVFVAKYPSVDLLLLGIPTSF